MRNLVASISAAGIIALLVSTPVRADDPEICRAKSGDVAIEACNRVINNQGRYTRAQVRDAYINRGHHHYARKNYDLTVSDTTEAIRIGPPSAAVIAYGNRGNAHSAKREYEAAIRDYTQALKLEPGYTSAYTGRGMAYENIGDIKRALTDYRAALAVPPRYSDGQWAHDTARQRIAMLTKSGGTFRSSAPPNNMVPSGTLPADGN